MNTHKNKSGSRTSRIGEPPTPLAKQGGNKKIKKKITSKIAQNSMQQPATAKINSSALSSL